LRGRWILESIWWFDDFFRHHLWYMSFPCWKWKK
jgi:hypothetical protein